MDIYVGGLPFKMTEKELRSMFENYGEVESAKIIIDKITRQNKGFGFVTMPNNTEASLAIKSLNNFKIGERTISVTKSEPKAESGKKRSFGKGFKGGNYAGKSSSDTKTSFRTDSKSESKSNFRIDRNKTANYGNDRNNKK